MSEEVEAEEPQKKKGLLMPLLVGLLLAVLGGGGGFWAVTQGPLSSSSHEPGEHAETDEPHDGDGHSHLPVEVAFVELETLVVSLGANEAGRNLIFTAALEVEPMHVEDVTQLSPRVMDVLNSYLRVISVSELSEPASLGRLRAQMLRRIQVVTGPGRVRDLLVTQFLVN
ncbi:flagellar basal body-associated protein FliL [Gymnodinialimonas hymeniacidonis]|uniref:flagellar basal body-associated FliL family protein n=1 Tax=Gymnodinialimonas hymeniacidonis TaxID=3126508 RepID=UPI0034C69957